MRSSHTSVAIGWLCLLLLSADCAPAHGTRKTKTYEYTAWMERLEAELGALGYKIGKERTSIQIANDLTVEKVPVSLIQARFAHGATIITALGYPSTVKSAIPKVVTGLAEDWLEPLWIDAKPDALKQRPRLELIRMDAKLHSELAQVFDKKDERVEKVLSRVPRTNLSMRVLFLADSKMVGLRNPISILQLLKRFDPSTVATEEDADSIAEEIIWAKEAGIGDGTYKSLPDARRVIQAAILENLGFEIGHPGDRDPARRKTANETLETAKATVLKTWHAAAQQNK